MGIMATLSRLNAALKLHDRELWYHLDVKNQVEETTVLPQQQLWHPQQ